jgi:GT2 family glycosyltransferase/glycosyltransferase involved in cell wall biosynthesis
MLADPARHLEGLLEAVAAASAARDYGAAERHADRARRLRPGDPTLILACARLLAGRGRHDAARTLLGDAAHFDSSPDWGQRLAESCLATGDRAAAADTVDRLLSRFAVEPLDRLPRIARHLLGHGEPAPIVGWIGISGSGRLAGFAPAGTPIVATRADGTRFSTLAEGERFELPVTWAEIAAGLDVRSPAGRLLGPSPIRRPAFRPEGEAWIESETLAGWVRLGWSPSMPVAILVEDETGRSMRQVATPSAEAAAPGGEFLIPLAGWGTTGTRFGLSAMLPDGSTASLAGSPVALRPAERRLSPVSIAETPRARSAAAIVAPLTSIVVPVYGGRAETQLCLASVLRTIDRGTAELIVIDDASPDPGLREDLERLAGAGRITLLSNERNLGFPSSCNKGMALRPGNDVVLLNADAEVYGDWLVRLRRAAYSSADIGAVSPLSNSGSVASYPGSAKAACDTATAAELDRLAGRVNAGMVVDLPSAVGFCLYLRRDCLDEIGLFDADLFGHGYGEEDDLCLRARAAGWRSTAAADIFVRHAGAASFGPISRLRMRRATGVLNELYPGFSDFIDRQLKRDAMHPARRALDEARLGQARRPSVLFVTLSLGGGIARHLAERAQALQRSGFRAIELLPVEPENSGGRCRLAIAGADYEDLIYTLPNEFEHLAALLARIGVERVEFHHFLGLSPAIFGLPSRLNVPYEVSVHDYVWICPRVTLVTGDSRYCGEPDLAGCARCVERWGMYLEEEIDTAALRDRSARLMAGAERVTVPSQDAARRLRRYFPDLRPIVLPWETVAVPPAANVTPIAGERIRVALIGALADHKGFNLLIDCARDAERRGLPLEFVVIGFSQDDHALFATGRIFVTGQYAEGELDALIARERCQAALFASVAPETWCYSLSHALRAALPIVAFSIGALTERLSGVPFARLVSLEISPESLNDVLLELATARPDRHNAGVSSRPEPSERPLEPERDADTVSTMESRGNSIVADSTNIGAASGAKLMVSSSVQVLTLPEGLYAFSVREGAVGAANEGELNLPALQVAAAPSTTRRGQINILAAPSMTSPWLTRVGDAIVAQITGGPCQVLLTSLATETTAPLDIEVRRLDQRQTAASPPPEAAQPTRIVDGSNRAGFGAPIPEPAAVRLQVLTHIQNRGDVPFVGSAWAGYIGQSLWVEAFALAALDTLGADAIEYKARTAGGFETPWLSGGVWCGTRGMGVPLVEFAIRMSPEASARFECEYSGAFFSGNMIGPLRDGQPCRSRVPNDPLEAVQIRVVERRGARMPGRP